jgi:hypothetical protein
VQLGERGELRRPAEALGGPARAAGNCT